MIAASILLLLVPTLITPVLTCRSSPETCETEKVIARQQYDINIYRTRYQESMKNLNQPQAIFTSKKPIIIKPSVTKPKPIKPKPIYTTKKSTQVKPMVTTRTSDYPKPGVTTKTLDPPVLRTTTKTPNQPVTIVTTKTPAIPQITISCGTVAVSRQRIISGHTAREKQYPWQVYIRNSGSYCGGVLIASQWILTAAHCIVSPQSIMLGSTSLVRDLPSKVYRNIDLEIVHESYRPGQNDIALIKMDESVIFNDYIRPACLPNSGADFISNECHVSGWGLTDFHSHISANELQEAHVKIMDHWECYYSWSEANVDITDGHMCTEQNESSPTSGACFGDSGGPLSCLSNSIFYVAGVVSRTQQFCKKNKVPDLFTKVSHYRRWIEDKMSRNT